MIESIADHLWVTRQARCYGRRVALVLLGDFGQRTGSTSPDHGDGLLFGGDIWGVERQSINGKFPGDGCDKHLRALLAVCIQLSSYGPRSAGVTIKVYQCANHTLLVDQTDHLVSGALVVSCNDNQTGELVTP